MTELNFFGNTVLINVTYTGSPQLCASIKKCIACRPLVGHCCVLAGYVILTDLITL